MKFRTVLLVVFLLFSHVSFGESTDSQKKQLTELTTENEQLHKSIDEISEDVERFKVGLESVQSDMSKLDERNWNYIENYYDRISNLLTILGIIVAAVSIGVPLVINWQHDRNMQKQLDTASKDAKDARKSLEEVQILREKLNKLRDEIDKAKEDSYKYTIQAKVSELLSSGNAKYMFGEKEGAIKDYDKVIELNPNNARAYYNRGIVKCDFGDNYGAISDYNKAIDLYPKLAFAFNNRGSVKSRLGDNEEAIKDYDKAIELKPDYLLAYKNRAILYKKMAEEEGNLIKKEELINKAEADEAKAKELKK